MDGTVTAAPPAPQTPPSAKAAPRRAAASTPAPSVPASAKSSSSRPTPSAAPKKTKTPTSPPLVLPGPKEWETWSGAESGLRRPLGTSPTPQASASTGLAPDYALPVRRVFSLPIWLGTTDQSLLRGMIGLQLERRGFGPDGSSATWDYRIIRTEGTRTLVSVSVLPPHFPDELQWERAGSFSLAARCWILPPSSVVVWEELGGLALAVTLGAEVIYWQHLAGVEWNSERSHEVELIRLSLEMQEIAPTTQFPIHLFIPCSPDDLNSLQSRHPLGAAGVKTGTRLLPQATVPNDLPVPPLVKEARARHLKAAGIRRFFVGGLGIYLALLVLGSSWVAVQVGRKWALEKEIRASSALVQSLQRTAQRWDALENAIQPEGFAVELLYQTQAALPPEGLRFTVFGIDNNKVTILGEAKSATAPYEYQNALKSNPALAAYRWNSTPPRQLPSGSWQFTLEATRAGRTVGK